MSLDLPTREHLIRHRLSLLASFYLLAAITVLAVWLHVFPALYGDEYDSLFDANHLLGNIHAFGYFVQLHFWSRVFQSDMSLRALSVIWAGLSIVWFRKWLASENLPQSTQAFASLLLVLNPFFLQYAFQIRFYSYFLATALLVFWRAAELRRQPTKGNVAWLFLAFLLTGSSHFFGWWVAGLALLYLGFAYKARWSLGLTAIALSIPVLLVLWPPALQAVVALVYRFTNPYADIPDHAVRGLSLGMVAKMPMTLYFFTLGERIYPLWWWVTVPILGIVGWFGLQGFKRAIRYPGLLVWAVLGTSCVAVLYLLLDPLAPSSLQGAAPRYLIFVLPIFWTLIALGASPSMMGRIGVLAGQVVALGFFLFPAWSTSGDLVDWPTYLAETVATPEQTCLVVAGRGRRSAERYAPEGTSIVSNLDDCASYTDIERILLVSSDYRLPMVRHFDSWGAELLGQGYTLLTNITQFPAQITVYQRGPRHGTQIPPARLDLPEQDLRLPMEIEGTNGLLQGFVRLDRETPVYRGAIFLPDSENLYIASSYRTTEPVPPGSPVLSLVWLGPSGKQDAHILYAGSETAAWDGACGKCVQLATWTKRLHLVGARAYPGAYRHFQASIWAAKVPRPSWPVSAMRITSLLDDKATVYFWGVYPDVHRE